MFDKSIETECLFVYTDSIEGADHMKFLLEQSKDLQMPIDMIYMSDKGVITQRTIIVNEISDAYLKAFCLSKQQIRVFKTNNILSASKPKRRTTARYA